MKYVKVTNPLILESDRTVDLLTFDYFGGGFFTVDGNATKENEWIARESATVIDEQTDSGFLDIIRIIRRTEINYSFTKSVFELTSQYVKDEIDTFYIQEKEAMNYQADNDVSTPFIDAIASAREMDRVVLINKIIAHLALYKSNIAAKLGKKQKYFDEINSATTYSDFNLLNWTE